MAQFNPPSYCRNNYKMQMLGARVCDARLGGAASAAGCRRARGATKPLLPAGSATHLLRLCKAASAGALGACGS